MGGCQDFGLCCSGRDSSCVGKGWKPDRSYGTCYCDQACTSALDCCHDYQQACPGIVLKHNGLEVMKGMCKILLVTYRLAYMGK